VYDPKSWPGCAALRACTFLAHIHREKLKYVFFEFQKKEKSRTHHRSLIFFFEMTDLEGGMTPSLPSQSMYIPHRCCLARSKSLCSLQALPHDPIYIYFRSLAYNESFARFGDYLPLGLREWAN
jgi:hypothetical protein